MAVNVVKDPISGKEMTLVQGKVDGVYFNEIKKEHIRSYNNDWTPTHRINIRVDGVYVGLGMTDREPPLRCKDVEGEYADVITGAEVTIKVAEVGEWNNKPVYNANPAGVTVTKAGVPSAPQASGGQGSGNSSYKRDTSGMEAGHCINAAADLLKHKPKDLEEWLEYSKKLHDITVDVKEEYKKLNPDMSDYDLGASVGHAIRNVCMMLTKTKVDVVGEKALAMLSEVSEPVLAYIKNEPKKEEPAPEPEPEEEEPEFDDGLDDEIPF